MRVTFYSDCSLLRNFPEESVALSQWLERKEVFDFRESRPRSYVSASMLYYYSSSYYLAPVMGESATYECELGAGRLERVLAVVGKNGQHEVS